VVPTNGPLRRFGLGGFLGHRQQEGRALGDTLGGRGPAQHLDAQVPCEWVESTHPSYILYTSGTTGNPKGVVHSHLSAMSFVSWAIATFHMQGSSVIANHAQWSFDLSVLDLWASLSSGARIELVPPEFALRPKEFVRHLQAWGVTHFYSVPSMIGLLESDGSLRERQLPELKHLLYAGEPFAIPRLRAVMQCMPQAQFYNLFGPTETNVCLYHKIPSLPERDAHQVPIGKACEHLTVELLDEKGHATSASEEGEICVAGPSVLTEYFRLSVETDGAFFTADQFLDGRRRYRTGDRASTDNQGLFWFHGRRDRLIKRRGFRGVTRSYRAIRHGLFSRCTEAIWFRATGWAALVSAPRTHHRARLRHAGRAHAQTHAVAR